MQSSVLWPRVAGSLLIALGLSLLAGWFLRQPALLQWGSAVAPVINTSACFLICGVCLVLASCGERLAQVRRGLGYLVSVFAAAVLAQDLLYVELGIDWRAAQEWINDGNRRPGRMAPNTACAFLLAGWTLGRVTDVRTRASGMGVQLLTFAILALGLTGLVGYAIELDLIYPGFTGTRMALPTALGVITIAVGLWTCWISAPWYAAGHLFQDDERIGLIGTSLLVIVAATTGVAGLAAQQTTLEALLARSQTQAFETRVNAFVNELHRVARNAQRAARNPALLRDAAAGTESIPSPETHALFDALLSAGAHSVVLEGVRGEILHAAGSPDAASALQARVGETPAMRMYWGVGEAMVVTRSALGPDHAPLGTLVLHEPVPLITRLLMQPLGGGTTSESGLCVERNDQMRCFPQARNPEIYTAGRLSVRGVPTPMALAVDGDTDTFKGTDYRGNTVLAAYGPIPGTELGLVVKQDTSELFAPVRDRLNWAGPFLLALVLVGAVLLRRQIAPLASRLHRSEAKARDRESRLQALVDGVAEGVVTYDSAGIILSANPAAGEMFGVAPDLLHGRPVTTLFDPADVHATEAAQTGSSDGKGVTAEVLSTRSSGEIFASEVSVSSVNEGDRLAQVAIIRDVTTRRAAEAALFREKERLRVTLGSIGDGVITTDEHGVVTYLNPVAQAMTGWLAEEAAGKPLFEVFRVVHEESGQPAVNPIDIALQRAESMGPEGDSVLIHRDGTRFPVEDSASPIRDVDGKLVGAVLVFHDVTQARAIARETSYQASHDALTGLINRRELERRLERSIRTARTEARKHSLLYLDLDHFKSINDTAGHAAGDELLRQLSSRIQSLLRRGDALARLGGDEFAILLENCAADTAASVAQSVVDSVNTFRFVWDDKSWAVGVSVGVLTFGHAQASVTEVLRLADAACYGAKRAGRNQIHVYLQADSDEALREGEMGWIARLEKAIAKGRFVLAVQPVRSLGAAADQCEVFVRLVGDDGTLIPPNAFLPAAERYGLIAAIDRWVISAILEHLSRDAIGGRWAINLSSASVCDATLPDYVAGEISRLGYVPGSLCLELTEAALNASQAQAPELLAALRAMGIAIALDDFGTGVASFAAIKNLHVDMLKIDADLIETVIHDAVAAGIVRAICSVADLAGIQVGAKGVVDDATLALLPELGVDFAQGFAVGPPSTLR